MISEIHLIPLERIKVTAQMRTEFYEDSITELAADIEQRGLLQPVLVNPIGDERYRLVCGERRLRAIRMLGQKAVPAVITKMDEKAAKLAQFAKNIQRKDMNLRNQAAAIRAMFDELGNLEAVAGMIKKSKGWVSKRVSFSIKNYSTAAINLLEDGECEDIKILNTINQAEKQIGYWASTYLAAKVKNKEFTRQQCRDWLNKAKEQKETETKKVEAEKSQPKPKPQPEIPEIKIFSVSRELARIERECEEYADHKPDVEKIIAPYSLEEIQELKDELEEAYERGEQARISGNGINSIIQFTANRYGQVLQHTAFLHGFFDSPFQLVNIIENAFHTKE